MVALSSALGSVDGSSPGVVIIANGVSPCAAEAAMARTSSALRGETRTFPAPGSARRWSSSDTPKTVDESETFIETCCTTGSSEESPHADRRIARPKHAATKRRISVRRPDGGKVTPRGVDRPSARKFHYEATE